MYYSLKTEDPEAFWKTQYRVTRAQYKQLEIQVIKLRNNQDQLVHLLDQIAKLSENFERPSVILSHIQHLVVSYLKSFV